MTDIYYIYEADVRTDIYHLSEVRKVRTDIYHGYEGRDERIDTYK